MVYNSKRSRWLVARGALHWLRSTKVPADAGPALAGPWQQYIEGAWHAVPGFFISSHQPQSAWPRCLIRTQLALKDDPLIRQLCAAYVDKETRAEIEQHTNRVLAARSFVNCVAPPLQTRAATIAWERLQSITDEVQRKTAERQTHTPHLQQALDDRQAQAILAVSHAVETAEERLQVSVYESTRKWPAQAVAERSQIARNQLVRAIDQFRFAFEDVARTLDAVLQYGSTN
jgi:hypothetical protein